MKRYFVLSMALVFVSAIAFADAADVGKSLSVRTFLFKHKQADAAAVVIKPLMGAEGTISIQPATNSLVITDSPENMKKIAAALTEFDTAPQPFHLTIRLVSASRAAADRGRVAEGLKDVEPQLAMLRFNVIDALGTAEVNGKEGDPVNVDLSSYRADFKFGQYDPASDSIQIGDFKLSKLDGDQLAPMLKTTLNLKLGRTVIIGVTRDAKSQRALMMVLAARR